jgi:hypothetical protein
MPLPMDSHHNGIARQGSSVPQSKPPLPAPEQAEAIAALSKKVDGLLDRPATAPAPESQNLAALTKQVTAVSQQLTSLTVRHSTRYLHVLSLSPSPLPTPTALDHSLHTLLRFSPINSMSKLPQDMQLATVQSAGREQFFGDALTGFDRVVTAAENSFDPLNHYSRFMPIVQSSGMGKSRLIDQYATKILNPSQTAGHV